MVIVTHESYDSVLVGTGKQKGLESLSENHTALYACIIAPGQKLANFGVIRY